MEKEVGDGLFKKIPIELDSQTGQVLIGMHRQEAQPTVRPLNYDLRQLEDRVSPSKVRRVLQKLTSSMFVARPKISGLKNSPRFDFSGSQRNPEVALVFLESKTNVGEQNFDSRNQTLFQRTVSKKFLVEKISNFFFSPGCSAFVIGIFNLRKMVLHTMWWKAISFVFEQVFGFEGLLKTTLLSLDCI